jgi:hypothetical protein
VEPVGRCYTVLQDCWLPFSQPNFSELRYRAARCLKEQCTGSNKISTGCPEAVGGDVGKSIIVILLSFNCAPLHITIPWSCNDYDARTEKWISMGPIIGPSAPSWVNIDRKSNKMSAIATADLAVRLVKKTSRLAFLHDIHEWSQFRCFRFINDMLAPPDIHGSCDDGQLDTSSWEYRPTTQTNITWQQLEHMQIDGNDCPVHQLYLSENPLS